MKCSLDTLALTESHSKSRKLFSKKTHQSEQSENVAKSSLDALSIGEPAPVPERLHRPANPWLSVGGLDEHVKSLRESIILPLLYPQLYEKLAISAPGFYIITFIHFSFT